jgi:hypothetical protein
MLILRVRNSSISDLRIINDYLRGIRNEMAVDISAIKMAKLDPSCYGKFPRPSSWLGKFKRYAFLSRLLHRISLPVWYFIGPLLFRLQCKKFRSNMHLTRRVKFDPAGQILGFSVRSVDVVHVRHIDLVPRQWLELPWLPLINLPADAEVISVASLLNDIDLDRSLYLATLAHRIVQGRNGMSDWGFQTYTAWRWFLIRLAVDKLPGPLITVEHFDRWAVLADGSVQQSRYYRPNRKLTLMQHGSVNANQIPRGLGFRLPSRLRSVNNLLAYSPADVDVFKSEIFSPRCWDRGVQIGIYKPQIVLSEISLLEGTPSILFVGYPLCEAAHFALLTALRSQGDYEIFYKPHPTRAASSHTKALQWTVVEGRLVFPRVDLLISYPSTLVDEYAAHDIPAIVHRMDVTEGELVDRLTEIIRKITSRYKHTKI